MPIIITMCAKSGAGAGLLRLVQAGALFLGALLPACAVDNAIPDPDGGGAPAQCRGDAYVAFDSANHAEQDARTQAHANIVALLEEGVEDPSVAAERFAAAQGIYQDSAELQGKVQGRADDRIDGRPNVGAELDARISQAFLDGGAALTVRDRDIAAETVNISLLEFFFLSVFHEAIQGQAAKWDEALGYLGSGTHNQLDEVRGLALLARDVDEEAGTALEARLFQDVVDGSCALAKRLVADDVDTVDILGDSELGPLVEDIDLASRLVFARASIIEATEILDKQEALEAAPGDRDLLDEARVELHELELFFRPLERLMRAEGAAADADLVRTPIDAALADDTDAWVETFDAAAIIGALQSHFGIT